MLLGKDGQLGWELQRSLGGIGDVVAFGSPRTLGAALDMSSSDQIESVIRDLRPAVIVNAAAYTAVDRAEAEPDLARAINATAPAVLAREAARSGALLVHYSTDYVFDGSGHEPRNEGAPTSPLNVYGQTKLEGEILVRGSGCAHLILRASWIYGIRGNNFAKTIIRLAQERETLNVVADQVGSPTGADFLSDVTAHALRAVLSDQSLTGTYHVCPSGHTTWHGYAQHVIECAVTTGLTLKATPDSVVPVPSVDYPAAARRPGNSRLDTTKLQRRFGLHLPDWRPGVQRMIEQIHHKGI